MKTQLLKVFKNNNFLSLANNMGVAIFGMLSFVIMARSFEKNYFGEWVLFIAAGNFFEMLRFGITRTAIIRFLAGAKPEDRNSLIGSNYSIGLYSTCILAGLIYTAYFLFKPMIAGSGYELFFLWYPVLSFINLPLNSAVSILHAYQKFDKLLYIRLFQTGSFTLFLIINILFLHWGIMPVLYVYLGKEAISSIICTIYKWDGLKYFFSGTKESNRTILNFGKYSIGTTIGTNLLKSTDTILLGLSPFIGTVGVAMYAVPLKLTEILEIPLRSFAFNAFPSMSKASLEGNIEKVKQIFYSYSGGVTFIILPIVIIGFIFAEQFILILGGPEYLETKSIFRFFCIYGLFISVDKFTGVALDSINKPKKNLIKVMYMASANILGDIFAIFYASKFVLAFSVLYLASFTNLNLHSIFSNDYQFSMLATLEMVSAVTILFTIIGIIIGIRYLKQEIGIKLRYIPIEGWKFFISIIRDTLALFLKKKI